MIAENDRAALAYWNSMAGAWRIPPPLSPSAEDILWYENNTGCLEPDRPQAPAALLLGVTPAIANMRWPRDTSLIAVDWSQGMLQNVWTRPDGRVWAEPVRADWRALPLRTASRDVAVGDGCYTALGSYENAVRTNAEIRRVLRDRGLFCLRAFLRPDRPEAVEGLFGELAQGSVSNLDLFRWRLAMAVHGSSRAGVRLSEVWRCWSEHLGDGRSAAERHGWPDAARRNFERWRDFEIRYYFPSLAELHALAAPCFEVLSWEIPRYEWGERFPRIVMRAR
jgi:SAM-dependent methyltransferase